MTKFIYLLQAFLAYSLYYTIRLFLSFETASNFGGFLGKLMGKIAKKRSKAVLENIQRAFPNKTNDEAKQILYESWENFGRLLLEVFFHDDYVKRTTAVGKEDLIKRTKEQNGGLYMGTHSGNWEIVPAVLFDVEAVTLYKAPRNPYIDKFILKIRGQENPNNKVKLYSANSRAIVVLMRYLKEKKVASMLIDQKIRSGVKALFFGRKVFTNQLFPTISVKYNMPITPLKVVRNKDKVSFTLYCNEPQIMPPNTGDSEKDIKILCRKMNERLEEWIKEDPSQWFWLHRRW